MANIKFMLRDMEAKTEQTIYITSRFGRNEKLMYATPLKIEPKFWDSISQRVEIPVNVTPFGHFKLTP